MQLPSRLHQVGPFPAQFSDLERVFHSRRDAHIVARWLNDHKDRFADLLYGEEAEFSSFLSEEEFRDFASGVVEGQDP